jgi:predicted membrane protein (TIGR00267 family)
MNLWRWITRPRNRLDVVAGFVDGILNALTLAAGRLLGGGGADVMLALRVGAASGLTTVFVFFVAHYAELRADLSRSEQELNLTSHGKLATSRLGQRVLQQSIGGALLASACGILGSVVSLLLCVLLSQPPWLGVAADIALLGVLGALLARSFQGRPWFWAILIMIGGAVLTWIGVKIDIAG